MIKKWSIFLFIFILVFANFSSASATPPPAAKIISRIVSNVASALFKWLWSLKSTSKSAISSRSMVKFEDGYTVETVFDGSKLGIEPYSVEVSPSGDLLVLDSENSNIYKISTPLSRYSRPKLVAGSSEGYAGHVDNGKPREARMNHPKGLTVDDRGNIYVADTMNMAIRKISDSGVVTIAGGNVGRGGRGLVDGPSEDARFSNDFDLVYIGSSCSILVVDRGNQAIREIQLNDDDCTYHYDGDLQLGMAVLAAAAFSGYMLALLQRRVSAMFSSAQDFRVATKNIPQAPYQRPIKSVRPPLIPPEAEEEEEEGLFGSMGKLFSYTGSTLCEILGGLFSRRKPLVNLQNYQHPSQYPSTRPMQESFLIPREDQPHPPPMVETRNYPFMTEVDTENPRHFRQSRTMYGSEYFQQQHYQLQQRHQQQHRQRHYSSGPQTFYEENRESRKEIVFGAVQEEDGGVVIKALDYGNPVYGSQNMRSRYNYMGYKYG